MRRWKLRHYAISSCVAAALLAGCGGSQPPIGGPLGPRSSALPTEREHPPFGTVFAVTKSGKAMVLHRFVGRPGDGANPYAGLTDIGGTLYGTTTSGGAYDDGTVFEIAASGAETVLHSFDASGIFGSIRDGDNPRAGLVNVNGTLYGDTLRGGATDNGAIFSITPSGTETMIYSFGTNGAAPDGDLLNVNGMLYGTTRYGGLNRCGRVFCGTVFKTTPSGDETLLYSFDGTHGADPQAGLINVNGTLYGTTFGGGNSASCHNCGTVFSITTDGSEKVLHSFGGGTDGALPSASLIEVKGILYGTTTEGGIRCRHGHHGCGTVYSITPSGSEKVLYSFAGSSDGKHPFGGLIKVNGTLYGTTRSGGVSDDGTVFANTTSGAERVVYSFGRDPGGRNPYARLLDIKGRLYGTTFSGGAN